MKHRFAVVALASLVLTACSGAPNATTPASPQPAPTAGITRLNGLVKATGTAGKILNLGVYSGTSGSFQLEVPASATIRADNSYSLDLPVPTVALDVLTARGFASTCNVIKNVDSVSGVRVAGAELFVDKNQPLTIGSPSDRQLYESYELIYFDRPFTREVIANCGKFSYQEIWNIVKGWNLIKQTYAYEKHSSASVSSAALKIDLYGN